MKLAGILASVVAALGFAAAAQEASVEQAKEEPAQREVRLAICAFGTAETMTPVEEWLGKTIHPGQYAAGLPSLPQLGENKEHNAGSVKIEWSTAKLEVTHETDMIQAENQRNRKLLNEIRLKVLNDPSRRYVPLAGDYLEAALFSESGGSVRLVALEKADANTRLVTVSLGDREEETKVVTVNAAGTKAGTRIFRQPYAGKVRDLSGNTLLAFSGVGECSETANSVVSTTTADPQRKLIEDVCRQIASKIFSACRGELGVASSGGEQPVPAVERRPGKAKWLVLDKMTYQSGVSQSVFEGIDKLLLTKLVQAKKYKCLDRDMYDTAAREEGFGGKAGLIPAGYAMSGEIVQLLQSGKSRSIGGTVKAEYIATVSIRANDLRTQQPYEAETLRVAAYCQTPKDMLVHVVKRVALAILMRDYPMYIMDYDDDDGELTLSYGGDFLEVGEQYEVRRRKAIVDDDTDETVYKEKTVGVCEVTDCGKNTSAAKLISGKAKLKDVLRFYDNDEGAAPPMPAPAGEISVKATTGSVGVFPVKKPRIAVAPFITKSQTVSVWGMAISARDWLDTLVDHMSIQLTNTGSFKTLDRSFGPEIDRELDRIVNDPNANPNDVCRLSKKLATDYLVVAEVMFSDVASPGTDYVTGLPLPPASAQFAEVRFRCVHAPTTEIVVSDIVRVDSRNFYGTAEIFTTGSTEWTAANIAAIIQSKIDPAGFERLQAERRAAAEAAAAAAPAPAPAPAPSQGVNLGF
ncbi:MAG: hypothetical protein IJH50_08570 [Kiritimatiellae bacterium]|nr:hypothetical protein [Kiritimatiellia bacterium]